MRKTEGGLLAGANKKQTGSGMVHIGLVTPSFPPMVDGGVAIATGRLVQYLLHYGHQITVLTQRPTAATPAAAEPSWVSSSALTIAYRAIEAPLHDTAGIAALQRWMQERHARCPFDVLLAYFVYPSGYLATRLGDALGVPVEWHLSRGIGHGIDQEGLRHGGEFLARRVPAAR